MNISRQNYLSFLFKLNGYTFLSFLLLLVVSYNTQAQVKTDPITIMFVADQHSLSQQNEAIGAPMDFYNEIVEAVDAKLSKFNIVIETMKWTSAKGKVRRGEALGIVGTYFHAHDWPAIYPYSYPLVYEILVSVCRKNLYKPFHTKWPEDYTGTKIGTVKGYDGWHNDEIHYREKGKVNFFEFPDAQSALLGVRNEVVDCTLFEENNFRATVANWQKQEKTKSDFNLEIVTYISKYSIHIGYSEKAIASPEHPYAREFIKAFDATLYQMLRSGELAPLFLKYQIKQDVF